MLSKLYQKNIETKFKNLYKNNFSVNEINKFSKEIIHLIKKFNYKNVKKKIKISEKTSVVICYGDSLINKKRASSIKIFRDFYKKKLKRFFNTIHFLPFYPSSSDSGFAVKDHYKIDQRLGNWSDIYNLSKQVNIMADVVINHSSSRGLWFQNFLKEKKPGKDYFLIVDKNFNSSNVIRPRDHKLLKKIMINKKNGYLWRTFSQDQIDLNFKNPAVLLRFIKIIINLINHGVTIFRLDAIAYLWKESGSKCINLNQTHEIIKLLRLICNFLKIQTIIVTETNLPEKENLSYFGNNDEANWIYNFSLAPLLVQAFLFENSTSLNKWSKRLPLTKKGNNYLNFIASHDGIGMRPVEGLLSQKTIKKFLKRLKLNGSKFSFRKIGKNTKKVYEANITVFNALQKSEFDKNGKFFFERYLSAHAIMISFEGVPAIYFNSLFGTSNDEANFIITGNNRDINRYRWNENNLILNLKNKNSKQSIFYNSITNLLDIRAKQRAFHPNAPRLNINLGSKIYCFKRISIDKRQIIICITNLTSKVQFPKLNKRYHSWRNLIDNSFTQKNKEIFKLEPFQTLWLSNS